MINREEAFKTAIEYFEGDVLATNVWLDKYALKSGELLLESSPDNMHKRLAKEFWRIESNNLFKGDLEKHSDYGRERSQLSEVKIFNYLKNFKYLIPQGSVMAGLGDTKSTVSLSNCVVIPELFDSYGGIFKADQQLAQLYKRRCGVGLDLSSLRPKASFVSNAAKSTSGAVSFMNRFSETTREVAQNGRRGALMMTMDVKHPDILEFLNSKKDLTKITGANISVKLSNEFMQALLADKEFDLQWPIDSENPSIKKSIKAKLIWDTIIENAHESAEPGVLFWDRQHSYSTSSHYPGFKNISTNPCSEIAVQGGDSCRLMAVNLFSFVVNPFTERAEFDYDKLYEVCYEGQRLMDDLVDLELESIEKIISKIKSDPEPESIKETELEIWELLKKNGKCGRRTGLGFTGLADAIAALGLRYGSQDSLLKVDSIMRVKLMGEWESSIDLAIERGAFEGFDPSIEWQSDFTKLLAIEFPIILERLMESGRRNISISTVAPTGSLSLLTRTSAGMEPVYMVKHTRRTKVAKPVDDNDSQDKLGDYWKSYDLTHPNYLLWQKNNSDKKIEDSPYFKSTAMELDWKTRIEIQSIIQKYTTHSISSTINLPNTVSKDLVSEIYFTAWKKKLKGITIYRDGSRDGVLQDSKLNISPKRESRPDLLNAEILRFKHENEDWIAVVGLKEGRPYEIFTGKADESFSIPNWVKEGWVVKIPGEFGNNYDFQYKNEIGEFISVTKLSGAFNKEFWNYAKLISGFLRNHVSLIEVVGIIDGLKLENQTINSWKNGVKRVLSKYIENNTKTGVSCPSCSSVNSLEYQEGCLVCKSCGMSEC